MNMNPLALVLSAFVTLFVGFGTTQKCLEQSGCGKAISHKNSLKPEVCLKYLGLRIFSP